jgi:hypothetical protein
VKWLFRASYTLVAGLTMALPNALRLLDAHVLHSSWRNHLDLSGVLFFVWIGFAPRPECDEDPRPVTKTLSGLIFALAICLGLVTWQGMFGLLGVLTALIFWAIGWIQQRRYYIATLGWLLAGLTVIRLTGWPEQDRHDVLFFLGGVSIGLHGAWELLTATRLKYKRATLRPPLVS